MHAPAEYKIADMKDSFYEELECVFDKFPKYHTKILLGDFSAKIGRELTIGNESLPEISNDNGVRVVNFTASKNLTVKNTMFPRLTFINITAPFMQLFLYSKNGVGVSVNKLDLRDSAIRSAEAGRKHGLTPVSFSIPCILSFVFLLCTTKVCRHEFQKTSRKFQRFMF
jgi:hypothetical protein